MGFFQAAAQFHVFEPINLKHISILQQLSGTRAPRLVMLAALDLIMITFPALAGAEDADRHARRNVASSHTSSSTHRRLLLQQHAQKDEHAGRRTDIVRRLRADAAWPVGPGMHLRSQLVHHAKVLYGHAKDPG